MRMQRRRDDASTQGLARGVIDTFRDAGPVSSLGTTWRAYSDRVVGGRSDAWARFEVLGGKGCVRLGAQLAASELEEGFAQVTLGLCRGGQAYDASGFFGVRFFAMALKPGRYAIVLREAGAQSPWRFWRASFEVGDEWSPVALPFSRFEPVGAARTIQRARLSQIALVAMGDEGESEVAIASLSFF